MNRMSKKSPISTGDSGDSSISRELKALRKVNAPWYFEAELFKRLRFQDRPGKTKLLLRPVPAYALSGIAVIILLIVGYNTFVRVSPVQDHLKSIPEGIRERVEPQHDASPSSPKSSPPKKEMLVSEREQRGPSAPGDAAIQARIMDRRPETRVLGMSDSAKHRDSLRSDSTSVKRSMKDSLDGIRSEIDTAGVQSDSTNP